MKQFSLKMKIAMCDKWSRSYLNIEETISQKSERSPTQIQGMVTVFSNWLNWWNVNAVEIHYSQSIRLAFLMPAL
jgi:hypothetical protein